MKRPLLLVSVFALGASVASAQPARPTPRPPVAAPPAARPPPQAPPRPAAQPQEAPPAASTPQVNPPGGEAPSTPSPETPPPAAAPTSEATPSGPGAAVQPTPPAPVPTTGAGVQVPMPPPPEAPPANPDGPRTAVIDAAPLGVDRSAATFVTDVLREAVGRLGFQVIPTQELYAAARDLSLGFPPSPEAVFQLEEALRAPVAVTAEVRAARRQYLVRLRVRVAVENQERVRDLTAGQFELGDALREALPALLVPPQTPVAAAETPGPPPPRRVRRLRVHPRRWELGGGAVVAFGPGRDSFVNALLFARAAYYVSDRLGFTGSISYANLRGRQGRVSNALFLVGVETAVDLVPQSRIFIPLRLELGYLPANGPVARITAGLSFPLARRVRLEVDLVSPTLWVLPETSPVSLDLAASVFFSL